MIIKLLSVSDNKKIQTLKLIKDYTNLGLIESKEKINLLPSTFEILTENCVFETVFKDFLFLEAKIELVSDIGINKIVIPTQNEDSKKPSSNSKK